MRKNFFVHKNFLKQKLDENEDNSYLDSQWADTNSLKRSFQGLNDIKWKPRQMCFFFIISPDVNCNKFLCLNSNVFVHYNDKQEEIKVF